MSVVFSLKHIVDTTHHAGWLWYSHDALNPPTDRQVVNGKNIIVGPGRRLAPWYFLSDDALTVLNGSQYYLSCSFFDAWHLRIYDPGRAALFKLRFM